MSALSRVVKLCASRRTPNLSHSLNALRAITTSNKKDDTTTVVGPCTSQPEIKLGEPKKLKYFQDYGFDGKTEEEENNNMNFMFFTYITLGFVTGYFLWWYKPNDKDWYLREGYLELRRREELGLPLIDPNYIDPSTIYLPSDEELGDYEIIV